MRLTRVSLSVTSRDPEIITRAVEALARAAAGLALEGVDTFLMTSDDNESETGP